MSAFGVILNISICHSATHHIYDIRWICETSLPELSQCRCNSHWAKANAATNRVGDKYKQTKVLGCFPAPQRGKNWLNIIGHAWFVPYKNKELKTLNISYLRGKRACHNAFFFFFFFTQKNIQTQSQASDDYMIMPQPHIHLGRPSQLVELPHSEFEPEIFSHSAYVQCFCDICDKSAILNVLQQNYTNFDIGYGYM